MLDRCFITGTDTDVGKTRVTAALALALKRAGQDPTIVKPVQTGVIGSEPGDAERAGMLAGCRYVELARFAKPADPWSAAIAENAPPPGAEELARELTRIPGAVVAEGAGGIAVPLNARQQFGHLAMLANLDVVLVVGLRLGCINHALLSLAYCERMNLQVTGCVLVERWEAVGADYRNDVERSLRNHARVLGVLPYELDEARSVALGTELFTPQGI